MAETKRMFLLLNGKRYRVTSNTILRRTQELARLKAGRVDLLVETK